jgi:hypothetical protein
MAGTVSTATTVTGVQPGPADASVFGAICFERVMFMSQSLCSTRSRMTNVSPPAGVVKAIVGLRPSFSAQVRWGEPGAPVDSLRRCYDTDSCGA